jgi:hypothetical protein
VTRYRLIIMPLRTPKGPWRATRRAALEDAVAQHLGSRDEHDAKRIYLDELAEIERDEG